MHTPRTRDLKLEFDDIITSIQIELMREELEQAIQGSGSKPWAFFTGKEAK